MPDFRGRLERALDILEAAPPDVMNHNLESVPRLYKQVRPGSDYAHSLRLLREFKARVPGVPTKSGLMVGLGETDDEISATMRDMRAHDIDMLTLGQYLQPSKDHLPVLRYVHPDRFADFEREAYAMGFRHAAVGALVRSSYHADKQAEDVVSQVALNPGEVNVKAWRSCVAWCCAMLASSPVWTATLPTPAEIRGDIAPYIAKPLPTLQSIVGIPMPPPSPMVVVASFGDRSLPADGDRGYALGRTLNELLFGAHGALDVETPMYYALDTRGPNVTGGRARDSRANAHRVASREGAQWCVYGDVEGGASAYRIAVTIDRCGEGSAITTRVFAVASDAGWPGALRDICEHVIATAASLDARSKAACARGAAVRPQTFIAYAAFAATSGMPRERLDAVVAADPAFAPAVIELIDRLPEGKDKAAYLAQIDKIIAAAGTTPAVAMAGYSKQLARNAWKLEHRPFPKLFVLIRAQPQLRGPWLLLASGLSDAVFWDYPGGNEVIDKLKHWVKWEGAGYYPNEVTHLASLAASLDYYTNWPGSYRARWQMGFALSQYALMLRGIQTWDKVPRAGKKALRPLMRFADEYIVAALDVQPAAVSLWVNRIVTVHHTGGDRSVTFDAAVAVHPKASRIYETAMNFAQEKWGGSEAERVHVQEAAIRNNPDAEWAKTLTERHAKNDMREN